MASVHHIGACPHARRGRGGRGRGGRGGRGRGGTKKRAPLNLKHEDLVWGKYTGCTTVLHLLLLLLVAFVWLR